MFPITSTKLYFESFKAHQFDHFFSWYGNAQVMAQVSGKPLNQSQAESHFENVLKINSNSSNYGYFATFLKEDKKTFLGVSKFTKTGPKQAELGYGLLPLYWGKGFAREMLEHLILHGKNLTEIDQLLGIVRAQNLRSVNLLLLNGFSLAKKDPTNEDTVCHYLLDL